ncbi:hypothetical protein M153_22390001402, partial [Pseudoloma neurophilia]
MKDHQKNDNRSHNGRLSEKDKNFLLRFVKLGLLPEIKQIHFKTGEKFEIPENFNVSDEDDKLENEPFQYSDDLSEDLSYEIEPTEKETYPLQNEPVNQKTCQIFNLSNESKSSSDVSPEQKTTENNNFQNNGQKFTKNKNITQKRNIKINNEFICQNFTKIITKFFHKYKKMASYNQINDNDHIPATCHQKDCPCNLLLNNSPLMDQNKEVKTKNIKNMTIFQTFTFYFIRCLFLNCFYTLTVIYIFTKFLSNENRTD